MKCKGFHLLDSLVALAVFLIALAGISSLNIQAKRAQNLAMEETVARNVMSDVQLLVSGFVHESTTRYYDFRGLPCKAPGKFAVRITRKEQPGTITWYLTMTWNDWNGKPRELTAERQVWRPL